MSQDKLDEHIKNQLEQHRTTTDRDLLWQKIQAKQRVAGKLEHRYFNFWLVGIVFFLGSLVLLLTYQFRTAKETTPSIDQLTSIHTPEGKGADAERKTTRKTDASAKTKIATLSGAKAGAETKMDSTTEMEIQAEARPSTGVSASEPVKKATPASILNRTEKQVNLSSVNTALPKTPKTATMISGESSAALIIGEELIVEDNKRETNSTGEEKLLLVNERFALPASNSIVTGQSVIEHSVNQQLSIWSLSLEQLAAKSGLLDVPKVAVDFKMDLPPSERLKRKKPWSFYTGIGFSYGKAIKTLSDKGIDNEAYLQLRTETETNLDAQRLNLDFIAQHKSGFYLKSGLEYEQINERFESYNEQDSTEVKANQVLAIVYAMDGSVTEILGDGEEVTTYWHEKKRYNRYRYVDVPVVVGYHSTIATSRLGWFVESGAAFNLWFGAAGEILDLSGQPLSLALTPDLLKARAGVSLLGSAGLSYRFIDKYSLYASPSIKYNLSSISGAVNALEQKYLNVGLRVGLRVGW